MPTLPCPFQRTCEWCTIICGHTADNCQHYRNFLRDRLLQWERQQLCLTYNSATMWPHHMEGTTIVIDIPDNALPLHETTDNEREEYHRRFDLYRLELGWQQDGDSWYPPNWHKEVNGWYPNAMNQK